MNSRQRKCTVNGKAKSTISTRIISSPKLVANFNMLHCISNMYPWSLAWEE